MFHFNFKKSARVILVYFSSKVIRVIDLNLSWLNYLQYGTSNCRQGTIHQSLSRFLRQRLQTAPLKDVLTKSIMWIIGSTTTRKRDVTFIFTIINDTVNATTLDLCLHFHPQLVRIAGIVQKVMIRLIKCIFGSMW